MPLSMEISIFKLAIALILAFFLMALVSLLISGIWLTVKVSWLWIRARLHPYTASR